MAQNRLVVMIGTHFHTTSRISILVRAKTLGSRRINGVRIALLVYLVLGAVVCIICVILAVLKIATDAIFLFFSIFAPVYIISNVVVASVYIGIMNNWAKKNKSQGVMLVVLRKNKILITLLVCLLLGIAITIVQLILGNHPLVIMGSFSLTASLLLNPASYFYLRIGARGLVVT